MYKIGLFSQMTKVTVKALHHYDELNLLKPNHIDAQTGYRYYSAEQILRVHNIVALKESGFSLAEIAEVLYAPSKNKLLVAKLHFKEKELLQAIEREEQKLRRVRSHLKYLQEESGKMSCDVVIKKIPSAKALSLRAVIPAYAHVGALFEEMCAYMAKNNCKQPTVPYWIAVYHDGEYKESNVDVEICGAVADSCAGNERIRMVELAEVEQAACLIHKGAYENIRASYSALLQWISDNNYEICAADRESYIAGPWSCDSTDDYVTELQIPITKKL